MAFKIISSLAVTAAADLTFEQWCGQFPDQCSFNGEDEIAKRKAIFEDNKQIVSKMNSEQQSFTLSLNQFAALRAEEVPTGANADLVPPAHATLPELGEFKSDVQVAEGVNWVTQGYVTPVKNQGQCGSCWAFSTNGVVEAAYAQKTGPNNFIDASEQQLVDCTGGKYGNQGCSGGWPYAALQYQKAAGVCSQATYPYTATDGSCKDSSCSFLPFSVTGYQQVSANDESALIAAINQAPVSITVYVDSTFQMYSSGILTGTCKSQINHAVVAAGYDTDYYLVKNSWGASWGESGYIRIARGTNAACIVSVASSVPSVSVSSVEV